LCLWQFAKAAKCYDEVLKLDPENEKPSEAIIDSLSPGKIGGSFSHTNGMPIF
jgi:predicted TPR repeat methyltransferase